MNEGTRPLWYLYLLLKNRWFLVKALLIIMIPTVVITFMLKKKYTVSTLIMPPEDQSFSGMSLASLGISDLSGYFSGGSGFSLPLMTTMSDVFEEMLNSRTLAEHVILSTSFIDSTDLRSIYEKDEQVGLYWARKKFADNLSVSVTPSGFLEIQFTSGDPWYSVEVSNFIIAALDSINIEINTSRLVQSRIFLEQRMQMADSLLESATANLQDFEQEYGVIAPEEEFTVFIENIAELKRQYIGFLSQAAAIRAGITGGNSPTALFLERRAEKLLDVIKMLESGNPAEGYEDITTSMSPDQYSSIQYEYAGYKADFEMALSLSGMVRASLQQAIVAEHREQTSIRVLDPPRHPGWKSKPKRIYILLEVFLLSFILLFGFLVARENILETRKKKPELWEPWRKLFAEIRKDFSFRKKQL